MTTGIIVLKIITITLALGNNSKLINAEGIGKTSAVEISSDPNNKQSSLHLNPLEDQASKEARLHFRTDLIVTEHFNVSKSLDGVWSYSICCPLGVVECEDEILILNSSDYSIYSLAKDGKDSKDEANQGWLEMDYVGFLLSTQSSYPKENTGIVNYKINHTDYSNLGECKLKEFQNPSDHVAVRIKLHGLWIGSGELILRLMINSTAIASRKMTILVLPPTSKFGLMPTLGLFVGFSINIFGFALTVEKEEVLPFLRKPLELVAISIAQYIIFPSLAWCINQIISPPLIIQFMMICTACASAGAITNICSVLSRARLNLNVLSLLVTPFLGIVALPVWVLTVGNDLLSREFKGYKPIFPWLQFMGLKALFLMPGILVICVKLLVPSKARTISLIVRPIAFIWVLIMLALLAVDMMWTLGYAADWRVFMGPVALLVVGAFLFFPLSYALTQDSKTSLTMTIQGIAANPSYSIILCLTMVPKPFTPIPVCISIIYSISVISIALIAILAIRIWHHFFNKKADSTDSKTIEFSCPNGLESA